MELVKVFSLEVTMRARGQPVEFAVCANIFQTQSSSEATWLTQSFGFAVTSDTVSWYGVLRAGLLLEGLCPLI